MKKLLLAICGGVIFISSASAAEINNTITDSVQLTVNGAGLQSTRIGSSYAVSGNNVSVTTMGGLTGGSATAPATLSAGDYDIGTDEASFNFSESLTVGDTVSTGVEASSTLGTFSSVNVYSDNQITAGGTAGSLAGGTISYRHLNCHSWGSGNYRLGTEDSIFICV